MAVTATGPREITTSYYCNTLSWPYKTCLGGSFGVTWMENLDEVSIYNMLSQLLRRFIQRKVRWKNSSSIPHALTILYFLLINFDVNLSNEFYSYTTITDWLNIIFSI